MLFHARANTGRVARRRFRHTCHLGGPSPRRSPGPSARRTGRGSLRSRAGKRLGPPSKLLLTMESKNHTCKEPCSARRSPTSSRCTTSSYSTEHDRRVGLRAAPARHLQCATRARADSESSRVASVDYKHGLGWGYVLGTGSRHFVAAQGPSREGVQQAEKAAKLQGKRSTKRDSKVTSCGAKPPW
jgi:hypothetical protein